MKKAPQLLALLGFRFEAPAGEGMPSLSHRAEVSVLVRQVPTQDREAGWQPARGHQTVLILPRTDIGRAIGHSR